MPTQLRGKVREGAQQAGHRNPALTRILHLFTLAKNYKNYQAHEDEPPRTLLFVADTQSLRGAGTMGLASCETARGTSSLTTET